ncbi:hypothetical protein [Polyangium sp. 6x1]|uniref:hypothetical protein n=1 Tax=Polyangium sp. 6x1 TaxID=3042689 RepID=UPI002482D22A|nr:hypothetical protein [Polyangium sp. 6x1]MDI1451722.1 hypothetical protein [Polyangium sp. 6x1]
MLRLSRKAVSAFADAAYRNFAQELYRWWSRRLPWFVEFVGEDRETLGLHVIEEAASYGYVAEADIMRYSIGYIYFGSRFPESPLHENLLERCHWGDQVAPILKLARVLDHVDMLLWDGTFSTKRGCLENLPLVTDCPLVPLELHRLEVVLKSVLPRRLVHLSLERLADYVHLLDSQSGRAGIPAAWKLRAAILGVFLGWNWMQSPAWAWIVATMQRGDTDTIMRRLYGSAGT